MSKANGIMSDHISKLKALEEENAELRDELDDWKGNAEGFQPDAYMKLPVDADGVPIEVGDTVYCDEEVRPLEVVRLHAGDGGYCTVGVKDSEGRIISADAPRLSHKSPDSWEKLADDVADFDAFEYCVDVLEIDTSDFTEEQERGTMKADVVRRAKKLAGIEEEAAG